MIIEKSAFFEELKQRSQQVTEVFNREEYRNSFRPEVLREAVYSYLNRLGKRFRPGVLLFSCAAVGGQEADALLAAAAVEVYHTWTLVHDDIIDNDTKRRGYPTIHEEYRMQALNQGYQPAGAAELGRNVAILTGDLQHAWAVRLLLESVKYGVPEKVVLYLVGWMENELTNGLLEGEALDVLFADKAIEEISEADVLRMLELKTGVLYEFAALAGAAIGLRQVAAENKLVGAIGRFARQCGTAFQLQDDILGITGDEKLLGKAVGSDIREGKRTTIVLHAFANANPIDKQFIRDYLGNPAASQKQVEQVKELLIKYKGIEYTKNLAERIVSQAIKELEPLADSKAKDLLLTWAKYVVNREF